MWAAPPLGPWTPCFTATNPAVMCRPISFPISVTTTNPAAARCVPNKLRLYSQLRNLDLDNSSTTDISNLGKAVAVAAVKSGSEAEQKQQNRKLSRAKYNRQRGAKDEEENEGSSKERETKLSGFDVLRALEKATAQKMKKKRKERDGSALSSRKGIGRGRGERREDNEELVDYDKESVRPLSIKVDWGTRLDELEKRLQQLLDTTAA
ncbi:PREDICTED: uncharacterized protein LOC109231809 [Nicotiana attenuata]|uniref:Uncharacterized protein n=1 Tax=Nicotiana attenuata TaxID=49451 RepID=A0A1J6I2X2_NICAT|nr:PREDICTED: uncharacterized protein LOC109231809 [Nicotiana attenuata]OIS99412.1 hypothetical protein A4A49_20940 [Nicotiana attenuata]